MKSADRDIITLIIKQVQEALTVEESIMLEQWANQHPDNRELLQQLTTDESLRAAMMRYYEEAEDKAIIWNKIEVATDETTQIIPMPVPQSKKYPLMAAAATVAAIFTIVAYFVLQEKDKPAAAIVQNVPGDVLPGGNKALLKLSGGKTIVLDDAKNGLLTEQGSVQIEKQDGQLSYTTGVATTTPTINTLETPVGGQFQLKLPDGTRVWLNAASSITYPTSFTGNERRVSITGEGYFEVTKDANKPFIVDLPSSGRAGGGRVEVLGTHFNINAYDDEAAVKTSLLEGKVKVVNGEWSMVNGESNAARQTVTLAPGQQAVMQPKGPVQVKSSADMEEVVAWKNGEFLFQSADLSTLMRQVARWYDIEIVYPGGVPKDKFSGKIGRNVNLSQLLEILRYSEVRFDLKGRMLTIHN